MPIGRWNGCSFLSIDPGIRHTGYARYRVTLTGTLELLDFGKISPGEELDTYHRVSFITGSLQSYVETIKPAFAFVEHPPDTIYEQKKSDLKLLIARAQNVFKLVGVAYSIFTLLHSLRVEVIPILPVHWQERSPKLRGNLDVKEWSLQLANILLEDGALNQSRRKAILQTKADENIADAICLGYRAFKLGLANSQ